MNGTIDLSGTAEGFVTQLQLSGYGPNSGEITLGITQDDGSFVQVFGGILGDTGSEDGLDAGVFAAFLTLASTAYVHRQRVTCSYWNKEKLRFSHLAYVR